MKVITSHRVVDENIHVRYRRCPNCQHNVVTHQVLELPPQFHEKIVPKRRRGNKPVMDEETKQSILRTLKTRKGRQEWNISIPLLAATYDVSERTIKRLLRERGYSKTKFALTAEQVKEIRKLHAEKGLSPNALARKFLVCRNTVVRVLRRESYAEVA